MTPISAAALISTFVLQTIVLSGAGVAAQVWLRRWWRRRLTRFEALLVAVLAPTLLGYAAFWVYFASALAGRYFSFAAVAAVVVTLLSNLSSRWGRLSEPALTRASENGSHRSEIVVHGRLIALTLAAGVFYLAALAMYPGPKFTDTAGGRFMAQMPGDNEIPRIFAERLYIGVSPKHIGGDWLSSDRPPLQTGLALVSMPLLRAAGFDIDLICGTAGVWFQLLWIPALWCFLRWLGLREHEAHAATAALTFTGSLLFNSIFVWPKLGAAALVLMGFVALFAKNEREQEMLTPAMAFPLAGALMALGTLAHGGVMFSLLALVPLAWRRCWRNRMPTLLAAAVFFALTLPWTAYQKFYEPPGNRLVKWHIAGQIPPDARGVAETLRDNYRELGWAKAWEARRINLAALFYGDWRGVLTPRAGDLAIFRRNNEVSWTFRLLAVWAFGVAAIVWLAWRGMIAARGSRASKVPRAAKPSSAISSAAFLPARQTHVSSPWRGLGRRHALAAGWAVLTLLVWVALMFLPTQTLVHQGSYVTQLLMLGLLAASLVLCGRWVFLLVAFVQSGLFLLTWLPPPPGLSWPVNVGAGILTAVMAVVIAAMAVTSLTRPPRGARGTAVSPTATSPLQAVGAWWRAPRLTWWVVAAIGLLLLLRKPHALHTPQLWAEDGTIFLAFNDLLGWRAFLEPYMGYLHTLPRLIAWAAARLLDPAWWPAFYNGVSFTIWLAVIARTFSPRLNLPGKPWLALAFVIGPQTGEILFNITNLQWITAFLLIQQALIARPATMGQRVSDLAIVALIGLTGPFIIALGPLLAWRWWRDRNPDTAAVLAVATACALVQAWLVVRTGPKFEFPPFAASTFFEVIGQRMLLWPLLGDTVARTMPPIAAALLGNALVLALIGWTLRPHPRRGLRAVTVAAFLLMMAAMIYRSRPDTWAFENLIFSDRYFYIPRVLLVWLLVWEFDAVPRVVAWCARAAFLAIALVHLKGYTVPEPPNYQWPQHVQPIREGLPANIPTLPEGWVLEYQGRPEKR